MRPLREPPTTLFGFAALTLALALAWPVPALAQPLAESVPWGQPVEVQFDDTRTIETDAYGFLWLLTETSLSRFDGAEVVERDLPETLHPPPGSVRTVKAAPTGGVFVTGSPTHWFGTWSGSTPLNWNADHIAISDQHTGWFSNHDGLFAFDPSNPTDPGRRLSKSSAVDWMAATHDALYVGSGATIERFRVADPNKNDPGSLVDETRVAADHQVADPEVIDAEAPVLGVVDDGLGGLVLVSEHRIALLTSGATSPRLLHRVDQSLTGAVVRHPDTTLWVGTQHGDVLVIDAQPLGNRVDTTQIQPVASLRVDERGNMWALLQTGTVHLKLADAEQMRSALAVDESTMSVSAPIRDLVAVDGTLLFWAEGVGAQVLAPGLDPTPLAVSDPPIDDSARMVELGPLLFYYQPGTDPPGWWPAGKDLVATNLPIRSPDVSAPVSLVNELAANPSTGDLRVATAVQHSSDGRWWLGTQQGLYLYDSGSETVVRRFTTADGLPSNDFIDIAAVSIEGTTYLGTSGGIAVVPRGAPRLELDRGTVVAGCVAGCEPGQATASDSVTIGFSSIDFRDGADLRLRYRLGSSTDQNWTEADSGQRTVTYTALEPGHYIFEVQLLRVDGLVAGSSSDLTFNGDRELSFEVVEPFWQRNSVRSGLIVAALTAIAVLGAWMRRRARWRIDQTKQLIAHQTAAANEAADRANAVAQARSELMATVGHDLRTPLLSIMGYADLIRMQRGSGTVSGWSDRIIDAGREMESMVLDLSDATALETGKLVLTPTAIDVAKAVESVAKVLEPAAERAGLTIVTSVHPDLAVRYIADGHRLRQVLSNLVSNAVKYSDGPTVEVGVDVLAFEPERIGDAIRAAGSEAPSSSDAHTLQFFVRDGGPGPDPAAIDELFEPYARGAEPKSHGLGLGLAICREIVDRLGGHIEVDLDPNMCTFRFDVELEPESPHRRVDPAQTMSPVLVVARNQVLDPIGDVLDGLGLNWASSASADAALDIVRRDSMPTVIVDIELGQTDGRQLAKDLRALDESLPILGVATAMSQPRREPDFDLVLQEPVSRVSMRRTLQAIGLLGSRKPQSTGPQGTGPTQAGKP